MIVNEFLSYYQGCSKGFQNEEAMRCVHKVHGKMLIQTILYILASTPLCVQRQVAVTGGVPSHYSRQIKRCNFPRMCETFMARGVHHYPVKMRRQLPPVSQC